MRNGLRIFLALWLMVAPSAFAQPRAWLDREQIGADETATLNIEVDGVARPEYDPLLRDFSISGRTSRTQMDTNGVRSLYAVALRPLHDGRIAIPALAVGNQRTAPLLLTVTAARAPTPTHAGDDVFLESEADSSSPYVQQAVGWVVRLYSAAPLISGQLDQPAPDGASLQQVGEDARYSREVAGRHYDVVERRYQLIPERSGTVTVPGAKFEGRGAGGFFDEIFGDRGGELSAQAPAHVLQVRPVPTNAPQPWLPLRDLQLRYVTTPRDLRAGSAATLTIEITADGATSAQMPELQLPPIAGVQVFPDPVQADDTFREGRPRTKLTRRFSLVPARAGAVSLPPVRLGWWDVTSGSIRTAELPALSWQVTAADGSAPHLPATAVTAADNASAGAAVVADANRGWVLATLLFAALWLFTLVWGLHQRSHSSASVPASSTASGDAPAATAASLKQALDTGDLGDVASALCALARPPVRDLDELTTQLDDHEQCSAIEALQRARWGNGDGVAARRALRSAFSRAPRWRKAGATSHMPLPPLYPPE